MIDWIHNLNDQEDWTKAEVCWLASLVAPDHACCESLTFTDTSYQMMAHRFLPNRVARPDAINESGRIESTYVHCLHRDEPMPMPEWDFQYGVITAHQLMFYTDFGRIPFYDQQIVDFLTAQSADSANNTDEWVNECRIGLSLMGISCDPVAPVEPTDWASYHPAIVAAILDALE